MTVDEFVKVNGELYVIDALAEYLPGWLVDLIHSRGDAIGGLTVRDVAPIVRDTDPVIARRHLYPILNAFLPDWAEGHDTKMWTRFLIAEIVDALREALDCTADEATVEYHVEVSMRVNGELIDEAVYEGEIFALALHAVEQFADRI
jgi:hypothetical protein